MFHRRVVSPGGRIRTADSRSFNYVSVCALKREIRRFFTPWAVRHVFFGILNNIQKKKSQLSVTETSIVFTWSGAAPLLDDVSSTSDSNLEIQFYVYLEVRISRDIQTEPTFLKKKTLPWQACKYDLKCVIIDASPDALLVEDYLGKDSSFSLSNENMYTASVFSEVYCGFWHNVWTYIHIWQTYGKSELHGETKGILYKEEKKKRKPRTTLEDIIQGVKIVLTLLTARPSAWRGYFEFSKKADGLI